MWGHWINDWILRTITRCHMTCSLTPRGATLSAHMLTCKHVNRMWFQIFVCENVSSAVQLSKQRGLHSSSTHNFMTVIFVRIQTTNEQCRTCSAHGCGVVFMLDSNCGWRLHSPTGENLSTQSQDSTARSWCPLTSLTMTKLCCILQLHTSQAIPWSVNP